LTHRATEAKNLINAQGSADEEKAFDDCYCIAATKAILCGAPLSIDVISSAWALDTRLRQEYPLIDSLQSIANQIGVNLGTRHRPSSIQPDDINHRLRMDECRIWFTTLAKHPLITDVQNVLPCVDEAQKAL
jgi:hypothetical protein